jgi:hypothetical protein
MFTIDNVHNFLLDEKLITVDSFLGGDFEVTSINRRNRNLQITTLSEGSYLIKQVMDLNSENSGTLANEIDFYTFLNNSSSEIKPFCPEVKYADKERRILILEFYTNAIQLWKYYRQGTADNLPLNTIASIGKILSKLHSDFSDKKTFNDPRLGFLHKDLPFIFKAFKPEPRILSYTRRGAILFLENIQSDGGMMETLESVARSWEINAVIHGDIKLDNFLVIEDSVTGTDVEKTLKLIDWEMVQMGDLAWDVAGVFQDFIFWWAISMPDLESPEEMVRNAAFPITKLKPGIIKFWESYCESSGISGKTETELLQKVVRFAGLRVLQTAYEISSKFDDIPPIGSILLGIGKSILRKPEEAAKQLFGIQK